MGFLLYEHGLRNDDTVSIILLDELIHRKSLPPIYVHSQVPFEELQGLLFLAGQEAVLKPMAELSPMDIVCNAHYIAAYPMEILEWT